MEKTLGGDRLGAGKKMKVHLHGYERSTHDMGYIWRSTMSAGTLVPFLDEIALPGDTFDINLDCFINTHPTIGPLFGSYKVQLDIFQAPIRLYNAMLHNNALNIGRNMSQIYLPQVVMTAIGVADIADIEDLDNCQINPSSIAAYLGIRGIGITGATKTRQFNATSILAYWEIYKNYYANKQEEIGAVVHTPAEIINETVDEIRFENVGGTNTIPVLPTENGITLDDGILEIEFTGAQPEPKDIMVKTSAGFISMEDLADASYSIPVAGTLRSYFNYSKWGTIIAYGWRYRDASDLNQGNINIATFPLTNIDDMRQGVLSSGSLVSPFTLNDMSIAPYRWIYEQPNGVPNLLSSQEGLAIKTYQSDLFNNWLSTEWIDGAGGITEVTSIDTTGGSFSLDTLNLSKKVYDMLNRIAVSGGTYDDWLDAVYAHDRYTRCESPMYMGGLIKELVFQEVVSNSEAEGTGGTQPLGTLAGKGTLAKKHKGGHIVVKVDEPSVIIGIVSLTPRIDYSQGNKWHTKLQTLDDLHKPALDEIGFQELITEQMAWWSTENLSDEWTTTSAGKQPAWINYMTNVNVVRGNFAIRDNEMFMTLNRRYEYNTVGGGMLDLTTYIDPVKYNYIFANTAIDAQNFWVQIGIDMTVRRKMSGKLMPNL